MKYVNNNSKSNIANASIGNSLLNNQSVDIMGALLDSSSISIQKPVIVCDGVDILEASSSECPRTHFFALIDGTVYNGLSKLHVGESVVGIYRNTNVKTNLDVFVEVIVETDNNGQTTVTGKVKQGDAWVDADVQVVPVKDEMFSRFKGIIETDHVSGKTVFLAGLGSVGSAVLSYLVQSGVTKFILGDYERLEMANFSRHVAGLESAGRMKTAWARDYIHSKNPYAEVEILNLKVEGNTILQIKAALEKADIAVCSIDNREGKLLFNRLAVETGVTTIYAGAMTRAYGAQVLRCIPGSTPCYNCFVRALPEREADVEVSNLEQAKAMGIHYADKPAPIQAGLRLDIEPASHLAAKLVVQELVKDKDTPLSSLNDDLSAHWYLWLNRREPGTEFEHLEPLECHVDGLRVLRWIGVDFPKDEHCPVCGNGLEEFLLIHGNQKHTQ